MARETRIGLQILKDTKKTMKRFLVLLPLLQQEELDLDKMFKETKWKEIQDVEDKGYEVEKVTMVAGVRGNEAEHEILEYLYYLIDTKTGQNSLKLSENSKSHK
tara:strand:+ start:3358 stop:3669 length:312 start_codon:yes stop_codon:yes gene_type:complete